MTWVIECWSKVHGVWMKSGANNVVPTGQAMSLHYMLTVVSETLGEPDATVGRLYRLHNILTGQIVMIGQRSPISLRKQSVGRMTSRSSPFLPKATP